MSNISHKNPINDIDGNMKSFFHGTNQSMMYSNEPVYKFSSALFTNYLWLLIIIIQFLFLIIFFFKKALDNFVFIFGNILYWLVIQILIFNLILLAIPSVKTISNYLRRRCRKLIDYILMEPWRSIILHLVLILGKL